jgi:N-acetylneuraminate lyase
MVIHKTERHISGGIFAALPTAFDANDKVDTAALGYIVESLLRRGVEGFYVGGSTGECFLLSEDERKEVLETVLATAGGKVPVIAHAGALSTEAAVSLAEHAAKAGATAVSATPPLYFSYDLDEIQGYYADIAEASGLPVIVYNIPSFSGRNFGTQGLEQLLNVPGVVGLKHTSMNLYELERIRKKFPERVIFSGYDEVFLAALSLGSDGMIGSTVNLMPELFLDMRSSLFSGNLAKARELQNKANAIIECLSGGSFFPALKYALASSGLPCGECRKPFQPISNIKKELIASKLVEYDIVKHDSVERSTGCVRSIDCR